MKTSEKAQSTDLPADVTADDLKTAPYDYDQPEEVVKKNIEVRRALSKRLADAGAEDLAYGLLQFYKTDGFGWVLTTLKISNGKRGRDDRYYAVTMRGEVCRVGNGPHVKQVVNVYLKPDNADRLWKYVELWLKGAASAGGIRDRISSRRAQGQEMRAQGRSFWTWDAK